MLGAGQPLDLGTDVPYGPRRPLFGNGGDGAHGQGVDIRLVRFLVRRFKC
ncbi:hypothetical protein [Streptomyces sp. NPDC008139]